MMNQNVSNRKTSKFVSKENTAVNEILRGELSATEAYEQVLEKVKSAPERMRLEEFLSDHRSAAVHWRNLMSIKDYTVPSESSGPWGTIVQSLVGTAKLLGNTAALKALKEGEEHGLKEYESFLGDKSVSPQHKDYVRKVLIPNQQRHINSLDAMMEYQ